MYIAGNRTLRAVLEYHARCRPAATFLIFEDHAGATETYTYARFDAEVNRVANALLRAGVRKSDKLNLHLTNCPEFLLFWFAAAKVGAVMVPTNPLATAAEMEYILTHSESTLCVTQPAYVDLLDGVRRHCPALRQIVVCGPITTGDAVSLQDFVAGGTAPPDTTVAALDEVAMLYTSGTTARPKGVLVTNAAYLYAGEVVAKGMRLSPEDRHLVVLPLFHGNAQYYSTMSTLVAAASMALTHRFSASRYFAQVRRHACTVGSLFAAPMRMILAQPRRPEDRDHRLRLVIFAQNVTAAQLDEWHERFGAPLMQIYGMTETVGIPTMNPLDGERRNMSIGLPALGYQCKVVDEAGLAVPTGTVGQLLVQGELGWTLMQGYFKDPQATAQVYRAGWLWTGDNVRADEDGYLHFVDRAKDMIKRAGENVAASEVESVINQHPKVFDAAVIGVPDPMRDEAVKAFVILKEGETAEPEEIVRWCAARLAKFKVPEAVEFRPSFPRTSVGKIQKHILRREETT